MVVLISIGTEGVFFLLCACFLCLLRTRDKKKNSDYFSKTYLSFTDENSCCHYNSRNIVFSNLYCNSTNVLYGGFYYSIETMLSHKKAAKRNLAVITLKCVLCKMHARHALI